MLKCPTCDNGFEPKNGNQKYCCNKCKKSKKYNCSNCEKDIIQYKNNREHNFCSSVCSNIYSGRTSKRTCQTCDKNFLIKKSALKYGYGKFCSIECKDKGAMVRFNAECPQCKKKFDTPNNMTDRRKYCSKSCMKKAFRIPIDKDVLIELYVEQEFTSRHIGRILNRDKKMVLDYLHYYDIKVRPDGMMNRERIKCKDGHLVRSYYERAFDNILYKNDINHEYDPRLPFNKRFMADFKVGDVYVEIWGMMSIESYRERRLNKLKMYKENNCVLLEVFPDDFKNLTIKLEELKRLIS